jgi:hypothetical protein
LFVRYAVILGPEFSVVRRLDLVLEGVHAGEAVGALAALTVRLGKSNISLRVSGVRLLVR